MKINLTRVFDIVVIPKRVNGLGYKVIFLVENAYEHHKSPVFDVISVVFRSDNAIDWLLVNGMISPPVQWFIVCSALE